MIFLDRHPARQHDHAVHAVCLAREDASPFELARAGRACVAPDLDSRVLCDCVLDQAAALFGIPIRELREPGRSRLAVARVRQIAMYVSHVVLGISMRKIGRAFDRDRTTVLHACQVVEELREAPEFDAAVVMMERLATALLRFRDRGEG